MRKSLVLESIKSINPALFHKMRALAVTYFNTILLLVLVVILLYIISPYIGYKALGPIFLLAILIVASFSTPGPIIFSAVASSLIWNYFFIPSELSLPSESRENSLMILSFLFTGLAGSYLVTELRKHQRNIKISELSEKLHQALLSSVSHELRTPITGLMGISTALKNSELIQKDDKLKSLIDEMIHSSERLNRVVGNLLDMSRLERGSMQLRREWFSALDLIENVRSDLKRELGVRNFLISGDSLRLFEGDYLLLQHALQNIVLNAIKYSERGAEIEIEVKELEDSIAFSIKDRGEGIPLGEERKIFEKFFRLPGSPSGGLGLGLSIVKSIIELHGGRISARNRDDEKGAIVEFQLPLRPTPIDLLEKSL